MNGRPVHELLTDRQQTKCIFYPSHNLPENDRICIEPI